jgi:hypothetical protein
MKWQSSRPGNARQLHPSLFHVPIHTEKQLTGGFFCFFMFFIQHCFTHCPSDSTVSEDAGFEPRSVATLALAVRCSNPTRPSPQILSPTRLDLIHQWLRSNKQLSNIRVNSWSGSVKNSPILKQLKSTLHCKITLSCVCYTLLLL